MNSLFAVTQCTKGLVPQSFYGYDHEVSLGGLGRRILVRAPAPVSGPDSQPESCIVLEFPILGMVSKSPMARRTAAAPASHKVVTS